MNEKVYRVIPGQVIFCDVDDTLIDHHNIPKCHILEFLKTAKSKGCTLYLWSQGGRQYAETIADSLGIKDLFAGILDKPDICIDDVEIKSQFSQWIHPIQLVGLEFDTNLTIG